jgi:hypothetical protein
MAQTSGSEGHLVAAPALLFPALFGPVEKALQLIAVFPGEAKEFGGVHVRRFGPEKGLKPPVKVRALPGSQPVALRRHPVVPQHR